MTQVHPPVTEPDQLEMDDEEYGAYASAIDPVDESAAPAAAVVAADPVAAPAAPVAAPVAPEAPAGSESSPAYTEHRQLIDDGYQIDSPPKRSWTNLPGPQIRLLAILGAIGGLFLFFLISRMVGGGTETAKQESQETTSTASQTDPEQTRKLAAKEYESAIVKQANTAETVNADGTPVDPSADPVDPETSPSPAPATASVVPIASNPPPRRPFVPTPAPRQRVTSPNPVGPRRVPLRPSPSPSSSPVATVPPEDPHKRYARMQAFTAFSNRDQYVRPVQVSETPLVDSTLVSSPTSPDNGLRPLGGVDESLPTPTPDIAIATGVPVQVGQTARAKLITPATWAEDVPLTGDVFAELKDPLGSLPKGTILTLGVKTASESGFLVLEAKSASVAGESTPLPPSLLVRGKKGKPLRGKTKGTGRGIKFSDVAGVALAGANEASGLINRPRGNTTFADGISQVSTDQRTDVVAAVGKGATDQLLATARERTARIQESRQPYFQVSDGTPIELFVTENSFL